MIETSRTHTATGAFGGQGGQITAATNASPIVITTTSAHGLVSGDQVQISGITINTAANGTFYATVLTTTTFSLYSDAARTVPVAGNGVAGFTAASIVSQAVDISGVTGDWTIRLRVESLTAGKNVEYAVEDSVDAITWISRATINVKGAIATGAMRDVLELRKYDFPMIRFGTANARLRVNVLAIDAATTAVDTCWYEQ